MCTIANYGHKPGDFRAVRNQRAGQSAVSPTGSRHPVCQRSGLRLALSRCRDGGRQPGGLGGQIDGLMARGAPRGRQFPDVRRFKGGNQTPRHTGTPNPTGPGRKSASETSCVTLRTGGRRAAGIRSRIIVRQSASSNPVTPTPAYKVASAGSGRESHDGRSNSNQKRRTAGRVNLISTPATVPGRCARGASHCRAGAATAAGTPRSPTGASSRRRT